MSDEEVYDLLKTGDILYWKCEYEKAKICFQTILKRSSINLTDRSRCLGSLGATYVKLQEYKEALDTYREQLMILKQPDFPNKEEAEITKCYMSMGMVMFSKHDYFEAIHYYEEALATISSASVAQQLTSRIYKNLANLFVKMHHFDRALYYFKKALTIDDEYLKEDHPNFAQTYADIASLYYSNHDYKNALEYFQKTLEIWLKSLPPTHVYIEKIKKTILQVQSKLDFSSFDDSDPITKYKSKKDCKFLGDTTSKHTGTASKKISVTDVDSSTKKNVQYNPANAKWSPFNVTIARLVRAGNKINTLAAPYAVYIDYDQEDPTIFAADSYNHCIVQWKRNNENGQIVAGGKDIGNRLDQLYYPTDVLLDKKTDSFIISDLLRVVRWSRHTDSNRGEILIDKVRSYGLAIDSQGYLYVSDSERHEVRRYPLEGDKSNGIRVAGGNGKGYDTNQLNKPRKIFVDQKGSLYISDSENHRVMKWNKDAKEGIIVAGDQGGRTGNSLAQLSYPQGLYVDTFGALYVADTNNHRVMCWQQGAAQGTVVLGENASLSWPLDVCLDACGNLYVAEYGNRCIKCFSLQ